MILFSFIIGLSVGIIVSFYKPSFYVKKVIVENETSYALPSVKQTIPVLEEIANGSETTNATNNYNRERLKRLKQIIPKFYKEIKEGINYHPALIFKVKGTNNGTSIHLLTFSLMEWNFIKTKLSDDLTLGKPHKVYLCRDGIVDVNYVVRGFWPPEVEKGNLEDRNVLAVPQNNGKFTFKDFSGNCTDNGFVFNYSGEFAGVCFGGNFIPANKLYSEVPKTCKIIYPYSEAEIEVNATNSTQENATSPEVSNSTNSTKNTKTNLNDTFNLNLDSTNSNE
jgi:hypothetical protein